MKRRKAYSILYDKKMPLRLKYRFYKAVERLVMLYGSEFLVVDNKTERRVNEADIVMLR